MAISTKLPDSEFEIMKAVWACKGTVSCAEVMTHINRGWKAQTVLTLLGRLVDKGFLRTEKHGNERVYFSITSEEEYLQFETDNFISRFHDNSFASLFSTLYKGRSLEEKDVLELRNWLDRKEGDE